MIRNMIYKTPDTSAPTRGILSPKRRKQNLILEEQQRTYEIASRTLNEINNCNVRLCSPSLALVEVAAVASRLSGKESVGKESAQFLKGITFKIIRGDFLRDAAISIAAKTKISGFDSIFIACTKIADSILITDDKRMHETALEIDIDSRLLREMEK